jgi:transposase
MSTLQKFKIKDRFQELKIQLDSQKDQLPPQTQVLLTALIQLMELIIYVFEERFTPRNSRNSSMPPSKNQRKKSAFRREQSKKGIQFPNKLEVTEPDEIIDHQPEFCHSCGLDIINVPIKGFESRQVLDIIIEKFVTEHRSYHKDCPCCGERSMALFPPGVIGPIQYGPMVKAVSIGMLYAQMSSFSRTQVMISELVGKVISESTLVSFVKSLFNKLEPWESWARDQLQAAPVLHADETGLNVNGKGAWVHVLSSKDVVLMNFHGKRGKEAMDEIGILPRYGGILVHDFWPAYYGYENLEHAACGAHLLRELEFIEEAHGHNWVKLMREVLLDGLEIMHKRKKGKLLEKEYATLQRRYRIAVTKGESECPDGENTGKRGRVAKTKARNLLERFRDYEGEVLRYTRDPIVPFTNNLAERDLRMVKVKQNVSGYFRSEEGARAFCRIRSYLLTEWRKGVPPIQALKSAIEGAIYYE